MPYSERSVAGGARKAKIFDRQKREKRIKKEKEEKERKKTEVAKQSA